MAVRTEESLCLQGWEEILTWGTCIYHFPVKIPETWRHQLFHSNSYEIQESEMTLSWWNADGNLPARVKTSTREGIRISEGRLHPNTPYRRDPSKRTKPLSTLSFQGRSLPSPPSDQQLLTISRNSSSPMQPVPILCHSRILQRKGLFSCHHRSLTVFSGGQNLSLVSAAPTHQHKAETGCNPGALFVKKNNLCYETNHKRKPKSIHPGHIQFSLRRPRP